MAVTPAPSGVENISPATSTEHPQSRVETSDMDENEDPEKVYEPLRGTTGSNGHNGDLAVQKTHSRTSRRSLDRSWSINDGYSCSGVGAEEEDKDEEAGAVAAEGESDFTVNWDENDPANPRNMNKLRRWLIVIICSTGSVCVTCTSSMYTMTYDQIMTEFHCSREVATLGLSFFIFGLGIGPLFLSPLSEFYGRRNIYIVSFTFFLIWLIPCAVAKNIQTMIVGRFFNGLSGSAFLSVAGGTVGDLFARHELAAPMMLYTASPFVGPEIGPLVGGFINSYTTWRWTFYVLLIWTGVVLGLIVLFVPETYHPVLLRRKAQRLRKETGDDRWTAPIEKMKRSVLQTVLRSLYRPMLLLALEPMCMNLCIFSAILLGILYLFFGAFNLVFTNVWGFTLWQVGLSFMGIFVGMLFGIWTDPIWRRNYARLELKHEQPIAGAPLVTIGLFIFAWTTYSNCHWIGALIGSAIFGTGTILVYSGVFTFLVDAYPTYAASALAANSFARSSFGAIFPLFGIQMYNNLGYHWATSLLAFLTLAMLPFPYIFFRYGHLIRKKSRFAASHT
ncbi:MFS transporter [Paecilomyces variotii No. 5]|uniref:MFS transporter n=1 Tax=Byssochlamys spectabilis (strain No. 5 / NBRC 109023) TaxID=1356009 RepID=V5G483_BYSSN|nr:MFS transporter [Paecilomyces variotii No. 5]